MSKPLTERISELETALQSAWGRRDGASAEALRARLSTLWRDRRAELAAQTHTRAADWSRTVEPRRTTP